MSRQELFGVPIYPAGERCASCGGACCRRLPGAFHPLQIGPVYERILPLLQAGTCSFDYWEGDPRPDGRQVAQAYYLRPATTAMRGTPVDASWGGACCFLTPTGCSLSPQRRPLGCLAMNPEVCRGSWDKRDSAIAWLEYDDVIQECIRICIGHSLRRGFALPLAPEIKSGAEPPRNTRAGGSPAVHLGKQKRTSNARPCDWSLGSSA